MNEIISPIVTELSPGIRFFNEDNMEGMRRMPDKFYDLAIVDPPYGINAGKMTMGSGKHKFKKDKSWDEGIPDQAYFDELFRVSENQIIWGGELLYPLPASIKRLDHLG